MARRRRRKVQASRKFPPAERVLLEQLEYAQPRRLGKHAEQARGLCESGFFIAVGQD
jgi:hypothetical protein